ncbi:MAG: hypothetical protein JXB26_17440 [Candidatus Aminicenantes bacterium]|nr:hypothetical protein [Candidatus Aminicenantes bacterium]
MTNISSFLYQFIVGGLFFFAGIAAAWRSGAYSWKNKADRRLLGLMILGFLAFFLLQGIWCLAVLRGW